MGREEDYLPWFIFITLHVCTTYTIRLVALCPTRVAPYNRCFMFYIDVKIIKYTCTFND